MSLDKLVRDRYKHLVVTGVDIQHRGYGNMANVSVWIRSFESKFNAYEEFRYDFHFPPISHITDLMIFEHLQNILDVRFGLDGNNVLKGLL